MFTTEQIKLVMEQSFPDAQIKVNDMTGTSDHFELKVVSKAFQGKSLVERHRMVYAALGPAVGNEIHALKLKTVTPEEAK